MSPPAGPRVPIGLPYEQSGTTVAVSFPVQASARLAARKTQERSQALKSSRQSALVTRRVARAARYSMPPEIIGRVHAIMDERSARHRVDAAKKSARFG